MARIPFSLNWLGLLVMLLLASCQAFGPGNSVATIDADLTMYALEREALRVAATAEQIVVAETVVAAGTRVARMSVVNAALGATLRANHTGTPEVRAVVVSAEDMGSSLEDGMMDDEPVGAAVESAMLVSNLSTAESIDPDSGCSSGTVREFRSIGERIYVTARVTALQTGSFFEVDWQFEGRALYRVSWLADYSKSFECIWFYATPVDFPFLPGSYAATLYADGEALGTTAFTIAGS